MMTISTNCILKCGSGTIIYVLNGLDLLFSIIVLSYGLHIGINGYAPSWLYEPLVVFGFVLAIAVLMSGCGLCHCCCAPACCFRCSSFLFALLGLTEFIFGLTIVIKNQAISAFLHKHQRELRISDEKLMKLEQYRLVPAYLLFAMVLIVTIRFRCTNTFHSIRSAMEYSSVAQQDEFPENKEQVIQAKYSAMRDEYRMKYDRGRTSS